MIIDTSMYTFSKWDIPRRLKALHIMDEHVKKYCTSTEYDLYWSSNSVGTYHKSEEVAEQCFQEFAKDESKFIQALWAFFVVAAEDKWSDKFKKFNK